MFCPLGVQRFFLKLLGLKFYKNSFNVLLTMIKQNFTQWF